MTTRHATKNDLDILVSLANSLWPEADSADLESELSQIIESDDAQIKKHIRMLDKLWAES